MLGRLNGFEWVWSGICYACASGFHTLSRGGGGSFGGNASVQVSHCKAADPSHSSLEFGKDIVREEKAKLGLPCDVVRCAQDWQTVKQKHHAVQVVEGTAVIGRTRKNCFDIRS